MSEREKLGLVGIEGDVLCGLCLAEAMQESVLTGLSSRVCGLSACRNRR
jgi:hypothetical protein